MKKQAFNPYLPSWEYVPDAEPYVFGNRVYIYGSHDRFGSDAFCMNDYVCWSAPVDDLGNWKYEGVIYRKDQDPMNPEGKQCLYAPDVQQGADGRFYLYYALNQTNATGVAVSQRPEGPYEFYGNVHYSNGSYVGSLPGDVSQFDPGVLVDDDGRVFLYSGFAPDRGFVKEEEFPYPMLGSYVTELETDMITVKSKARLIVPGRYCSEGTGYEGHEFFEASSMRKVGDRYYFIYSSLNGHELCYAVSSRPDGGFVFGGTLVSNGDIFYKGRTKENMLNYTGNTHGSIVNICNQWYVFYHRQTNFHQYSRQACAEPITIFLDGHIEQAEMTSCGLNGVCLKGSGEYEARIACNLRSGDGAVFYSMQRTKPGIHPYFTQEGGDREGGGNQYIANIQDGAMAGFKYFGFKDASRISMKLRGSGAGRILVSTALDEEPCGEIYVSPSEDWKIFSAPVHVEDGIHALYFTFKGSGVLDFITFTLE